MLELFATNQVDLAKTSTTSSQSFQPTISDSQEQVLTVLKTKCNVCHSKKYKKLIFTAENMQDAAPDIYTQVFVKKRMPKGKKIRLTEPELATLKAWLIDLNVK